MLFRHSFCRIGFINTKTMTPKASLKRLQFCNFKLDVLLEVTQSINRNLSIDSLLDDYEELLRKQLNIGKVLILVKSGKWKKILISGLSLEDVDNIDAERDLVQFREIITVPSTNNKCLRSFDVIIPVFHKQKPLAYVLIGDIEEEKEGVSPTIKHLHFIQTLTNIVMVAIENKRLFVDNLKKERLDKEMELASKMQAMLVPQSLQTKKEKFVRFEGFYLPYGEIGGDYYDFLTLGENEYGFCVADVSGKGISAALLMSNFQANLKALFTSEINLSDLLMLLNERVMENANGEKFITLFIAKYSHHTKSLRYINAGHNPPILYDKTKQEVTYLKDGCVGLGILDMIPMITEGEIYIDNPSKLLCFTDGLVETNYGENIDEVLQKVKDTFSTDVAIDKSIQDVIKKLDIRKDNSTFFDDIAMLGVDFL